MGWEWEGRKKGREGKEGRRGRLSPKTLKQGIDVPVFRYISRKIQVKFAHLGREYK